MLLQFMFLQVTIRSPQLQQLFSPAVPVYPQLNRFFFNECVQRTRETYLAASKSKAVDRASVNSQCLAVFTIPHSIYKQPGTPLRFLVQSRQLRALGGFRKFFVDGSSFVTATLATDVHLHNASPVSSTVTSSFFSFPFTT